MSEELTVQNGQIVTMDYTLWVDDDVVDSSEGADAIEFLQGAGNIIPGLESQLYGMEIGESKDVVVAWQDGYGEVDEDAFAEVPRNQFPSNIPMEPGIELQVQDQSGHVTNARIDQVEEEVVRLDFNHPLAGKELRFAVKITGIRQATEEEIEHGHAHGDHDHDYDEEDFDD
ncbi:MAG TPA: peptidylprolyl isomerase [Anaerolineales bacterium]|nr:peptidylprolyl isomerase [Anaerolineales bacterium]